MLISFLPLLLHFLVACVSAGMECGRNLHRTSKVSHTIVKSASSPSSSTSSSSTSSSGSEGQSQHPARQHLPVIRVVHIFNPTVIKTDAANFRSLVQELTGRTGSNGKKGTTGRSQSRFTSASMPEPEADRVLVQPHHLKFPTTAVPKRSPIYIPERLGIFSDIDISSFQEPVMDLSSMLPPLGEINNDVLPRFSF